MELHNQPFFPISLRGAIIRHIGVNLDPICDLVEDRLTIGTMASTVVALVKQEASGIAIVKDCR